MVGIKLTYLPEVLIAVATFAVVKYLLSYQKWKKIAVVKKLYVYPLKSAQPLAVGALRCTWHGVRVQNSEVRDRSFMVVSANGVSLTGSRPRIILVKLTICDGKGRLEAPDMESVTFDVPTFKNPENAKKCRVLGYDVPGLDCGDMAAEWFEKVCGEEGVRLVHHDQGMAAKQNDKLCKFKDDDVYSSKPLTAVFHNVSPVNILSQESLDDLNQKLEGKTSPVTEKNFRPNILVSDCPAYSEDIWRKIKIGSAEMIFGRNCARCLFPTVNPETGVKHPEEEPISTLRKYRVLLTPRQKEVYGPTPIFSSEYVAISKLETSSTAVNSHDVYARLPMTPLCYC